MVTEALGRVVRRAPRDHDRRRGPCRPLLLLLDDPRRMAHPCHSRGHEHVRKVLVPQVGVGEPTPPCDQLVFKKVQG